MIRAIQTALFGDGSLAKARAIIDHVRVRLSIISLLAISALSGCSDPKQVNLQLETTGRPDAVREVVSAVAARTGRQVESSQFQYGGPDGAQRAFALDDFSTAIHIQSALMECPGHDPCFSQTTYFVSIYAKWPWASDASLRRLAKAVADGAREHCAKITLESNSTQDVADLGL